MTKATYEAPLGSGQYPAIVDDVQDVEGEYGPQVQFDFTVQNNGGGVGRQIRMWASNKLSKKSKLYRIASHFEDPEKVKKDGWDPFSLKGRRVLLLIVNEDDQDRVVDVSPA